MSQLIVTFAGVAVAIGVITLIIALSYDVVSLPGETQSTSIPIPVPTPDTVPGLLLWLDGTSDISIGVGVSQWDDKSGQGNHVVQATATNQPTVLSNAINGKDAISFDGNDYLQNNGFTGGNQPQPTTIFLVLTPDTDDSASHVYLNGGTALSTERHVIAQDESSGDYKVFAGSWLYFSDTVPNDFVLITTVFDNASSEVFLNGVSKVTGNVGTRSLNGVTLAANYNGNSPATTDIALVLIYDGALTSDQMDDVNDYIETQFDLGMPIVGDYSGPTIITEFANPWADVQASLTNSAQTGISLFVIVLVVIASVVILFYVKRL